MPSPPDLSRIPRLNGSLCGCNLETATKIVAHTVLVFNSLMFLFGIIDWVHKMYGWHSFGIYNFIEDESTVLYFYILSYFFKGLMAFYLLLGIYQNKPYYIKTWVVFQGIMIVITVIIILIYVPMSFFHVDIVYTVLWELVNLAINVYFTLLVYSYYRELSSDFIMTTP